MVILELETITLSVEWVSENANFNVGVATNVNLLHLRFRREKKCFRLQLVSFCPRFDLQYLVMAKVHVTLLVKLLFFFEACYKCCNGSRTRKQNSAVLSYRFFHSHSVASILLI